MACSRMEIEGQNAASLAIHNCSDQDSCIGMEIWCPEKTANGERRCILEGGDELGGDSSGEMLLYAVNSWDDIEFVTPTKTQYYEGRMFCTKGFNEWCDFGNDVDDWQCDDTEHVCQTLETNEPTVSPTDPTEGPSPSPTHSPSPAPTHSPSPAPTESPSDSPSAAPTRSPSSSPSPAPTFSPSLAPSDSPTRSPSLSPSQAPSAPPTSTPSRSPSRSPSNAPSLAPSRSPSSYPSPAPSTSPSFSPSAAPLDLAEILVEVEDAQKLEEGTDWILCFMLFGAFVTVAASFVIMKRNRNQEGKVAVDDQKYLSVIMYLLQIIDMMTDLAFALQCRVYWLYGETTYLVEDGQEETFKWLYHLALAFVAGPYLMNIGSTVRITRQIESSPSISSYSKRYFREKSKIYTLLVLLSGGSFAALKLLSSNLMGHRLFSSGLSKIQVEHFRTHHVMTTVLIENVPQLMLQYWFMFEMNLGGSIVVISFISSIFNILRALTSAAIFWILHRNQTEVPFTITLSWTKKGDSSPTAALEAKSVTKGDLNPFCQCGRRTALAIALGEINVVDGESMKFEILSSQKQQSSCTLCGVFLSENTVNARARAQTEGDTFSNFMDREREIDEAVISAFDLDPVYCSKFIFTVKMTRSSSTSPEERAKLALDILREFKVSAEAN